MADDSKRVERRMQGQENVVYFETIFLRTILEESTTQIKKKRKKKRGKKNLKVRYFLS